MYWMGLTVQSKKEIKHYASKPIFELERKKITLSSEPLPQRRKLIDVEVKREKEEREGRKKER